MSATKVEGPAAMCKFVGIISVSISSAALSVFSGDTAAVIFKDVNNIDKNRAKDDNILILNYKLGNKLMKIFSSCYVLVLLSQQYAMCYPKSKFVNFTFENRFYGCFR